MPAIPDVSVVIPTRDRWRFLRAALRSALAQRGVSVEILVVDDGSRDETPVRLAEFDDARVRTFRNEMSRGVSAARNLGLRRARAPWVAFLDDDDLWAPQKLERQLEAARAAGAGFAYCGAVFVDEALGIVDTFRPPAPGELLRSLLPGNSIPAGASNVIARAGLVRRLGGFDEGLVQVEDWDLWIRLAEVAPAAAWDEPLVAYRIHPGNMVLRGGGGATDEIDRLAAKHSHLTAREGVAVDRVRHTRWIAWIHRREGRRRAAAAMYMRGAIRYRNGGNVLRAAGALLGERAMGLAGSGGEAVPPATTDVPWLAPYR